MIIDAYVRIHPKKVMETPAGRYNASIEGLLEEMNSNKIDKAILLALPPYIPNDYVIQARENNLEKFWCFGSINPLEEGAVEKLGKLASQEKINGLTLHPRIQKFTPSNPKVISLIAKAAELKLPIMIDTYPGSKNDRLIDHRPLVYDDIAKAVPEAKLIMGHSGMWLFEEMVSIAKINPNVYLELSGVILYYYHSPFWKELKFWISYLGPEKFIFGSDFPEMDQGESLKACKALEPLEEMSEILAENIKRLIKEE